MLNAASLLKFRSSPEIQRPTPAVTPFIMALDPAPSLEGHGDGSHPALGVKDLLPVLASLQPHLTQIFVRLPEVWPLSDWFELLPALDDLGFPYHLETRLPWREHRSWVGKLHALERLDRLRVNLHGFGNLETGPSATHLRMALDAGLNLWAVLPLEAAGGGDLEGQVAKGQAMGLRGLSFRLAAQAGPGHHGEIVSALARLYQRGYPVYLEGCLPLEQPPRIPGLSEDCLQREGVCFVDGSAQVWTCPHAAAPLGSLLDASLDALWATLPPRAAGEAAAKPPPALHLEETLRPLVRCDIRKEATGASLIRGYDFMPVTDQGLKVVRAFDGEQTLRQLTDRFGREAAPLALALFQRDMLRFVRLDDDHA